MIKDWLLILIFVSCFLFFLLLSFCFSALEAALMSLTDLRAKYFVHILSNKKSRAIVGWISNPQKLLTVILVGNNFTSLVVSSLCAIFIDSFQKYAWSTWVYCGVVSTLLIFLFMLQEFIPKFYAIHNVEKVVLRLLEPLFLLSNTIGTPIMKFLNFIIPVSSIFNQGSIDKKLSLSLNEFRHMLIKSELLLDLDAEQQRLVEQVFLFKNIPVTKVMTPWSKVKFISIPNIKDEQKKQIDLFHQVITAGKTKVPVVQDKKSQYFMFKTHFIDVKGYINTLDLLSNIDQYGSTKLTEIESTIKPLPHISSSQMIVDILSLFKINSPIVCVQDHKHHPIGIITYEDLINKVLGEAMHQYDIKTNILN